MVYRFRKLLSSTQRFVQSRVRRNKRLATYGAVCVSVCALGVFVNLMLPNGTAKMARIITQYPTANVADGGTAQALANNMCNAGYAVGFGVYMTNIRFDQNTGYLVYDVGVYFRRCNNTDTRSYAIVGNEKTCPLVGSYGGVGGGGPAYDCVKYYYHEGKPFNGPANLACGGSTGGACVGGRWPDIAQPWAQPGFNWGFVYIRDIALTVPNYGAPADTQQIGAPGGLCQFYKTGGQFLQYHIPPSAGCQPLFITVSWREKQWNLQPATSTSPDTVAQGELINYQGTVANTDIDSSDPAVWAMRRVIFNPGQSIDSRFLSGGDDQTQPDGWSGGGRIEGISQAIDSFGAGQTKTESTGQDSSDHYAIGTKVCYVMSVNNYNNGANNTPWWRHSPGKCTVVGVKPKTQFWGYDVRSGGKVAGSTSNIGGKTYGSWGEYGVLSTLPNGVGNGQNMIGSGSTVNGKSLTFANTNVTNCNGASYGCYGQLPYPSDLVNSLISQAGTCSSVTTISVYAAGVHCYKNAVTITSELTTPTTTNGAKVSEGNFPQMVIIAPNISIGDGVQNVDAWLIAANPATTPPTNPLGTISTCATNNPGEAGFQTPDKAALSTSTCSKPLKITGPVIAGKLYLYRTHYSTTDPAEPAETIDLRADAFLGAYMGMNGATNATPYVETQNVTELPPRL